MDIDKFINENYVFASKPCLYIVAQTYLPDDLKDVRRCGAAGTKAIDADLVWKGKPSSLNSRLFMYLNYWLPGKGTIYAALQVPAKRRTGARQGTNPDQSSYNIEDQRGIVLDREKLFHRLLTEQGLRWDPSRKNELFKGPLNIMIDELREVPGIALYTMDENDAYLETDFEEDEEADDPGPSRRVTPRINLYPAGPGLGERLVNNPQLLNSVLNAVDDDDSVTTVSVPSSIDEEVILVPARGSSERLREALKDGDLIRQLAQLYNDPSVDSIRLRFKKKNATIILDAPRGDSKTREVLFDLLAQKAIRDVFADIKQQANTSRFRVRIYDQAPQDDSPNDDPPGDDPADGNDLAPPDDDGLDPQPDPPIALSPPRRRVTRSMTRQQARSGPAFNTRQQAR